MKTIYLLPLAALLLAGCATHNYRAATPPAGPSLAEIQTMAKAQVSDSVIISQIQNSKTRYQLTADEIISLKTAGVSDGVLNALINSDSQPPPQTTTVVRESYVYPYGYPYVYPYAYVGPWPWFGWGYHGYYHHR